MFAMLPPHRTGVYGKVAPGLFAQEGRCQFNLGCASWPTSRTGLPRAWEGRGLR